MWAVEVDTNGVFRHGAPSVLFDSPGWTGSAQFAGVFEVAAGDDRFLIAATPTGENASRGPASCW